jgi:hypothetical protein
MAIFHHLRRFPDSEGSDNFRIADYLHTTRTPTDGRNRQLASLR